MKTFSILLLTTSYLCCNCLVPFYITKAQRLINKVSLTDINVTLECSNLLEDLHYAAKPYYKRKANEKVNNDQNYPLLHQRVSYEAKTDF